VKPRGDATRRGPLDFVNPIDLIVDLTISSLRMYGRKIITGVVLIAGLGIMSAAFVLPLFVVWLLIAVLGLADEPYKWLGSALILAGFVAGAIAAPLALIRVLRRSRRIIALTGFGDDEPDDPFATLPSPIVTPAPEAADARAARLKELDDRLGRPADQPPPPEVR
jgi:hypothetical protein